MKLKKNVLFIYSVAVLSLASALYFTEFNMDEQADSPDSLNVVNNTPLQNVQRDNSPVSSVESESIVVEPTSFEIAQSVKEKETALNEMVTRYEASVMSLDVQESDAETLKIELDEYSQQVLPVALEKMKKGS